MPRYVVERTFPDGLRMPRGRAMRLVRCAALTAGLLALPATSLALTDGGGPGTGGMKVAWEATTLPSRSQPPNTRTIREIILQNGLRTGTDTLVCALPVPTGQDPYRTGRGQRCRATFTLPAGTLAGDIRIGLAQASVQAGSFDIVGGSGGYAGARGRAVYTRGKDRTTHVVATLTSP
jgi:hypothetical protein